MDHGLQEHVQAFLESINHFLELLLGIRNLPESEEWQDDRVIGTLRLMAFIEKRHRTMYVRYVHRLVDFHVASGQFAEAGLTLKLHADLYEFNPRNIAPGLPDLDLVEQSEFNRKELLYLRILDYLSRGQAYETAIGISKGRLASVRMRQVANWYEVLQSYSSSMNSTFMHINGCRSCSCIRQTSSQASLTSRGSILNTFGSGSTDVAFQRVLRTSNSCTAHLNGRNSG